MKQLAQKPLFLSLLLAIVLWFVFDNFVVAAAVGLLTGFMVSMLHSLHVLKRESEQAQQPDIGEHAKTGTPEVAPLAPPPEPTPHTPPTTAPPEPAARTSSAPMSHSTLPQPDPIALAHLDTVTRHLHHCIQAAPGGFLPFDQWMQQALYAPGLGYYTAGSEKFGASQTTGDFTTAPELTPLFGQALAQQVAQVLREAGSNHVLEFGAGSGALAAALIPALRTLGIEPVYQILDVSADLRQRQQAHLASLDANIEWVEQLPHAFEGCVVANEVLDAMPVTLFEWGQDGQVMEIGVVDANGFALASRPASPRLQKTVSERMPPLPGYRSELNLQAEAWVTGLGDWLHKGAALLIDYGFPRHEYYHPQRAEGTLMCHYRHHAHADTLLYPGLQDITAHVDFTAMADAALAGGMEVLGYTTQARFLINCGLADLVSTVDPSDPVEHARTMGPVQKLLSEAEMGELFKVMAIGQGIDGPLIGFMQGDRRDRL